jgi:ParB family chromosome partitioning protein
MSSGSRARQLERLKGQLGGNGHDRLFGAVGSNLPQLIEVRLEDVEPSPHQPRRQFHPEGISSLAASIERHGLLQPIIVRRREAGEGYELVAGERRLRAFQRLGRATIPALLTNGNPEELTLIENIQREDLHPLEEAAAIGGLMQRHGYTQEAVGRVIGKPRATVGEIVSLNTLPEWLKQEARAHAVTRHILVQLARIDDAHELKAAWATAKDGASVRELKARRAASAAAPRIAAVRPVERTLAGVRRSIQELDRLPMAQIIAQPQHRDTLLGLRRILDRLIAELDAREG